MVMQIVCHAWTMDASHNNRQVCTQAQEPTWRDDNHPWNTMTYERPLTDEACHEVNALDSLVQYIWVQAIRSCQLVAELTQCHQVTQEHQQEDDFAGAYSRYLKDGTLPEDKQVAHRVIVESYDCSLEDDILYHSYAPRGKGKRQDRMIKQVVVPGSWDDICALTMIHWQVVDIKVRTLPWVHTCQILAKHGTGHQRVCTLMHCMPAGKATHSCTSAPLHPIPPDDVFARWHMDILGPLKTTKDGYQYILLFVDSFSKWCEAFLWNHRVQLRLPNTFFMTSSAGMVHHILLSQTEKEFHVTTHQRAL